MEMSDFAKRMVAAKKEEVEEQRRKDDKDVSDRSMLTSWLGPMWEDVKKATRRYTEEITQGMGNQVLFLLDSEDGQSFSIKHRTNSGTVRLDRARWAILGSQGQLYNLTIVEGNGVVWKYHPNSYTSEQVAAREVELAFMGR
jgi:hypothetical protein